MSWSTGLKRLSLVWWGFWVLTLAGFGLLMLVEKELATAASLFLSAAIPAVLHKVTCWVIDGFGADRPPKT